MFCSSGDFLSCSDGSHQDVQSQFQLNCFINMEIATVRPPQHKVGSPGKFITGRIRKEMCHFWRVCVTRNELWGSKANTIPSYPLPHLSLSLSLSLCLMDVISTCKPSTAAAFYSPGCLLPLSPPC